MVAVAAASMLAVAAFHLARPQMDRHLDLLIAQFRQAKPIKAKAATVQ
jgi:hypothetical protein